MAANWWDAAPVVSNGSPMDAALLAEGVTGKLADVARSIYQQESGGGKNTKTSNAGAVGGMQVIPDTFASVADKGWDINDPIQNARAGVRYLKQLDKQSGGDVALTAAGYYGGPGGMEKARKGIAVSDPRNPNAPNTLQYGQQVAARVPKDGPIVQGLNAVAGAVFPSANASQLPATGGNDWWASAPVVNSPAAPVPQTPAAKPAATPQQELLSSVPMRVAKGMKDPIDGLAQLANKVAGADVSAVHPVGVLMKMAGAKSPRDIVNTIADKIGGPGTFAGDVLGIKGATPQQLTQDIRDSEGEYQAARKATAPVTLSTLITGQKDPGFDVARLIGNVASPANAALAKVAPMAKVTDTVGKMALKGAGAGAIGAMSQPVTGNDYALEKATQVGVGAATGGVLTPALNKAAGAVATFVRDKLAKGQVSTPEAIGMEIKASLARDDIDIGQIPKIVMDKLTKEAQQAMAAGKEIDAAAMLRKMDFDQTGVKPLLGQVTRDPTQYTKELNLRGVQGVGEPIANRLAEQQAVISQRFRQNSAGAQNPYEAGQALIEGVTKKDAAMQADVRSAYKAFKDSTGKELEVPLAGLSQDYARTLADFGETIPGAVRKKFEDLGLLTGKQLKLLSIDDAENLIKTINKNYNPADRAQATALNELRGHVQNAILNVTDEGAGMEAAALANMARDTAKKRFSAIDSTPALKAAINGAEPDDFVKKYVINGKVREINKLAELLGPDGQKTMQQQMLKYLEDKAFGVNAAGDGAGRQASFNNELNKIGRNKLVALLGDQKTDDLFTAGRVMAYIQQRPAGSAVNESNTGAMVASLLGKIGGTVKGAPYINDFVIKPIQGFKDRAQVSNALSAQLPKQAAKLDAETVNALARIMGGVPVSAGAAAGYSVR